MKASFDVASEEVGRTLAAVLRGRLEGLSWARARQLCQRGKVTLAGERELDPATRVHAGDSVAVDESAAVPPRRPAAVIVYEDSQLVVIDKPAGVSSVPYHAREPSPRLDRARGLAAEPTALDLVRAAWREQRARWDRPLFIVHRIDKETSGLLAFAKTKAAERWLGALLRAHDVERSYLLVAHGALTDRRLESRLVPDRGDGLRGSRRAPMATRSKSGSGPGKRAVTHVRVLEKLCGASLCEARLETGKTHQIRIQLSENGHPLVGERVYIRDYLAAGGKPIACPRLLLHAATLGFLHPRTGAPLHLEATLPPDFAAELERLRRPVTARR